MVQTSDESEHTRWPVNLEDLNWYLYRLPSTGYRDPLWLYWVSDFGRRRLVSSAYGVDPAPFPPDGDVSGKPAGVPRCSLPGDDRQYPAPGEWSPLNIEAIECVELVPNTWDWKALWEGTQSKEASGLSNLDVGAFSLPRRSIHRVICRMFVHPSGNNPAGDAWGWIKKNVIKKTTAVVDKLAGQLGGWIQSFLISLAKAPVHGVIRGAEVACEGTR